jgi:hypothetical protein
MQPKYVKKVQIGPYIHGETTFRVIQPNPSFDKSLKPSWRSFMPKKLQNSFREKCNFGQKGQ